MENHKDGEINQRVKEVRIKLNLTQIKFAHEIGITNGFLASLESGRKRVTEKIFLLIVKTYNVNAIWLKTGEGDIFVKEGEQFDASLNELMTTFKQLNPFFKNFMITMAKQLLEYEQKEKADKVEKK